MTNPQIKLYRGSNISDLPNNKNNGAIYVLKDSTNKTGEVYLDIDNERFKLTPDIDLSGYGKIQILTNEESKGVTSEEGKIYIITDAREHVPGIKIGDTGGGSVVDLPYASLTPAEMQNIEENFSKIETQFNTINTQINTINTEIDTLVDDKVIITEFDIDNNETIISSVTDTSLDARIEIKYNKQYSS